MFHVGRVGSTVTGDLLNQHPLVFWGWEVFYPALAAFLKAPRPESFKPEAHYLKVMYEKMLMAHMRIFGAEVHFAHLDLWQVSVQRFVREMRLLNFRYFVILKRRNLLRKIVSSSRLFLENGRSKQLIDERPVLRKIHIDPRSVRYLRRTWSLFDLFEWIERKYEEAESVLERRNVLHLTYEDDVEQDPIVAYRRVCAFLGIEPVDVTVRLGRMNPFSLQDMLDNLDEVAAALRGTKYEWMLES